MRRGTAATRVTLRREKHVRADLSERWLAPYSFAYVGMSKRDPNDWMWERAAELLERTAWVQRRFFQVAHEPGSVWEPPVDVFESGDELFVLVALPGVDPEAIEVRCDGDMLVVQARRALPAVCGGAQVRRLEIPQGRFQRRIPLGIPTASIEARLTEHGVLLVRLRKGP